MAATGLVWVSIEGNGRDDWIRTSDLTHPKRARYQAALRPDGGKTDAVEAASDEQDIKSP